MDFLKKLGNKIKNQFTKKSDDNVIIEKNDAKIENSDDEKKKVSIKNMKNGFDELASQINDFLKLFNESQNNANANLLNLLNIIKNLYVIHNNLIEKIKSFGIEIKVWKKNFEEVKGGYEYKISKEEIEEIKHEIENEELGTILNNFKELKDFIANLNVKQLKNIKIEFESRLDKNKELEDMRKKILDSLKNLCGKCNNNDLITFFENFYFKKRAIEQKTKSEKAKEELKKREEEQLNDTKEAFNYVISEITEFVSNFNKEFNTEAYKQFNIIYLSIIGIINKYNKNFFINNKYLEVNSENIKFGKKFETIEWNIEFDENGNLSKKSNEQFLEIYNWLEKYTDLATKKYEKINNMLCKLLHFRSEEIKKYFKRCYVTLKNEKEQKEKEKRKEEEEKRKEEEERKEEELMKDPKYKKLKEKKEKERIETQRKKQKEKEKYEKERIETQKKAQKEQLNKRKQNIDKLKEDFLKKDSLEIQKLNNFHTVQSIIDFFNKYYKYYSDLYDIYECLEKSLFQKDLDAKIEYTNIVDVNVKSKSSIKRAIDDIKNNIPKFNKIKKWFSKICNPKDNNYRGYPKQIFNNNDKITLCLLILKNVRIPKIVNDDKVEGEYLDLDLEKMW